MSLSSVGASGLGNQSQMLAKMLSRLDGSQAATADKSSKNAVTTNSPNSAVPGTDANTALTGTDQSRLSDQILALLVRLQQQTPAYHPTTTPNNGSAAGAGSAIGKPAHALFSAMDSNGDGAVSQSEMDMYIQQRGGAQSQADKLFTALSQNGSSGISENQLASDIAKGLKAHHHHRHHHPAAGAPPSSPGGTSPTDLASRIFAGLDGNQDGTMSSAELTAAGLGTGAPPLSAASSGAPGSNASGSLASLDGNRDGSVSAKEFASFFSSLELQIQSDTATMANLMQKASQAYGAAAGGSHPANAIRSA